MNEGVNEFGLENGSISARPLKGGEPAVRCGGTGTPPPPENLQLEQKLFPSVRAVRKSEMEEGLGKMREPLPT